MDERWMAPQWACVAAGGALGTLARAAGTWAPSVCAAAAGV